MHGLSLLVHDHPLLLVLPALPACNHTEEEAMELLPHSIGVLHKVGVNLPHSRELLSCDGQYMHSNNLEHSNRVV